MENGKIWDNILKGLFAATILGIINVTYVISLAAFIFTGELERYFPVGVGMFMVATAVSSFIIAYGSSIPGVISTPKGNICAVLALMGVALVASAEAQQLLPTFTAAIVASTFLSGVTLFLLGRLKIGNFFRFIPYPVIAGYFAGAGFILVNGAFSVTCGVELSFAGLGPLFTPENLYLWVPSAAFGILLLWAESRFKHYLVMPGILFGGILLFFAGMKLFGVSGVRAQELGLLFSGFPSGNLYLPLSAEFFQNINSTLITGQFTSILAIVFLSAITVVLATSGIEIGTSQDVDINREFKCAGYANMASGAFGGAISFHENIDTVLSYQLGAKTRMASVMYAMVFVAVFFMGTSVIMLFPKPVMGALLFYQGTGLLLNWGLKIRSSLPRMDYLLVLTILLVVAAFGFLQGIGIGIVIAIILFVLNYSRIKVVKHELSGSTQRSKVVRPEPHRQLLLEKGGRIYILILQGYIFFGTIAKLIEQINEQMEGKGENALRHMLLDFRFVTELDVSAVNSLIRLKQMFQSKQVHLHFSGMNDNVKKQLQLVHFFDEDDNEFRCRAFNDLDHALEWCEEDLLAGEQVQKKMFPSVRENLGEWFPSGDYADLFMGYLEKCEFEKGNLLFRQGQETDSLYFVESGKIEVFIEVESGEKIRLQTMIGGTVLGEIGLYTKRRRSATAEAVEKCITYKLSEPSFGKMHDKHPEMAASFHKSVVKLLAERLLLCNDAIKELTVD